MHSAILFETPEQIFTRVFSQLKPRTPAPAVHVEFRKYANANSFIRWDDSGLNVRITDVLEGAPAGILETGEWVSKRHAGLSLRELRKMTKSE